MVCLAGFGLLVGAATPIVGDVADELQTVLRELRELRKGYYAERDERALEISKTLDTLAELRSDVGELERKRAEVLSNAAAVREEIKNLEAERQSLQSEESETLVSIKTLAQVAASHVTHGIPYRVEQRLKLVTSYVESSTASSAFMRLWAFSEEELRASRSGETYTDVISLPDGRIKDARFVRVGLQFLGFVTEDGRDVGLWLPGRGWLTGDGLSEDEIEAVRVATEVLDRRRGPQHVLLRMPLSLRGAVK
jgi:FtsZ-binding cell division protein ZapB